MTPENEAAPTTKNTKTRQDCFVLEGDALCACERELVSEEPVRIMVGGEPVMTLMCTPRDAEDLALGFLIAEGLIKSVDEVGAISFCPDGIPGSRNVVQVHLPGGGGLTGAVPDHRTVFSSCSVCGSEMIEKLADDISPFERRPGRLTPEDIFALAECMNEAQSDFQRTGGSHAAAVAAPPLGPDSVVLVREDIGRHNALDKVIGAAARHGLRLENQLLMLSSRLPYEMVAKAARAGVSAVAGVSAPSALSVTLARRLNMFLAGFVRGRKMTVYAGPDALRA